jgi:hypothetical protein
MYYSPARASDQASTLAVMDCSTPSRPADVEGFLLTSFALLFEPVMQ